MNTLKTTLNALLSEVESENPIDFADLPFDDEILRELALDGAIQMYQQLQDASDGPTAQLVLISSIAHLVLENLTLHARLLLRDQPGTAMDKTKLLSILRGKN